MEPRRPPIYLLTGLVIGLVLGVVYVWVFSPAETLDTSPATLRIDFKDTYRELIARAYLANQDLGRAKARLALLEDEDPIRALAVQAQLTLGVGGENGPARALGMLAGALQAETDGSVAAADASDVTPALENGEENPNETPPSITPTSPDGQTSNPATPEGNDNNEDSGAASGTSIPSITPTASPTPTATPGPPFVLLDIQFVCNPAINPPLIKIFVLDAAGNPVPGVAALISWDGNTNRFVTGLKPTFGLGYADFVMDPAVTYSLRLEDGGDPINSITGRLCEDTAEPFYGSWRFNFVQP
ncbi:MAG: hypothetical protein P8Y68_20750 [Anaerolineales bacterium]